MIITKKISEFNHKNFYKNKEISYDNLWYIIPYTTTVRNTHIHCNNLSYTEGLISHDCISFNRSQHTLSVEVCIPEDLIQFTRCYYFCPKIDIGPLKGDRNSVTYLGLIKFIYDGPKELEIIWRLSI